MPIGTASMVADLMEQWINEADVDGFNITYVSNPTSFEDVVEYLVPELQKRGLMWSDYPVPGGTFRENLHVQPGKRFLPATHPAKSKFERPRYLEQEREEAERLAERDRKDKEEKETEEEREESVAAKLDATTVNPEDATSEKMHASQEARLLPVAVAIR